MVFGRYFSSTTRLSPTSTTTCRAMQLAVFRVCTIFQRRGWISCWTLCSLRIGTFLVHKSGSNLWLLLRLMMIFLKSNPKTTSLNSNTNPTQTKNCSPALSSWSSSCESQSKNTPNPKTPTNPTTSYPHSTVSTNSSLHSKTTKPLYPPPPAGDNTTSTPTKSPSLSTPTHTSSNISITPTPASTKKI